MGDVSDAPCSLSHPAIVRRRGRPRKVAQLDIENVDIEDFAQQEMTKASYSAYFGPFLAYAVEGWNFVLNSSLQALPLLSLFNSTKYGRYARPEMLKFTCETSSAKMGVGVVLALFLKLWHINS